MDGRTRTANWKVALALVAGAALVVLLWRFIAPALSLTAGAAALAFLLSPLCRRLENVMSAGAAAVLSLLGTLVILAGILWLLVPALIAQITDLVSALPAAVETLRALAGRLSA